MAKALPLLFSHRHLPVPEKVRNVRSAQFNPAKAEEKKKTIINSLSPFTLLLLIYVFPSSASLLPLWRVQTARGRSCGLITCDLWPQWKTTNKRCKPQTSWGSTDVLICLTSESNTCTCVYAEWITWPFCVSIWHNHLRLKCQRAKPLSLSSWKHLLSSSPYGLSLFRGCHSESLFSILEVYFYKRGLCSSHSRDGESPARSGNFVTCHQQTFLKFPGLFQLLDCQLELQHITGKNVLKHSCYTWVLYTPRILQGLVGYGNRSGRMLGLECVNDISQMFIWSLFSCNMPGKMLTSNTAQSDGGDAALVWAQTVLLGCEYKTFLQLEALVATLKCTKRSFQVHNRAKYLFFDSCF